MTLKDLLTYHDDTYAYHSPLQPKDPTSAEIDRLKTLVSELEDKVKELASQKSKEGREEGPLIKDEKIRKAVRAWAEACRLNHVSYKLSANEFYDPDTRGRFAIKFTLKPVEVRLEDGKCYTIAELCGEEEEE